MTSAPSGPGRERISMAAGRDSAATRGDADEVDAGAADDAVMINGPLLWQALGMDDDKSTSTATRR